MATLILNANTASPITVTCQRAGKAAPRFVGSKSLSYNGTERTSIRGQAKIIPIVASFVDTATEASIQAAVMNGVQIACSGDILGGIQTLCSISDVTSNMIPGLPGYFEMSFTLSEVNASVTLLRYVPGDTVTGEAFSRSTTATYYTSAALVASAAINAKRESHYPTIGGTRSLLLEDSRINAWTKSEQFDDVAWSLSNTTISANATTAPDGAATADKVQEDNTTNIHFVSRTFVSTASTAQSFTIFAKAAERSIIWLRTNLRDGTTPQSFVNLSTGVVGTKAAGHTIRVTTLASSWFRIELVVNSAAGGGATILLFGPTTTDGVVSYLGTTGSGIYVWGGQHEQDAPFASSYIPTTTLAVTRGADSYSLPFTPPPQETTVYEKFVEQGNILALTSARLFEVSSSADAAPRFLCYAPGGFYSTFHGEPGGFVVSPVAAAPVIGDTDEVVSRLFADGNVDTTQSVNSGASTAGTQSIADTLATAWSGPLVWLNSAGTSGAVGFVAIQSFKIVSGARSLAEMRNL